MATIVIGVFAMTQASGGATPPPQLLWQAPQSGSAGSEGGQQNYPEGVATDEDTGHVFVADARNARVDEYDAWGQFVKAWGWGVANGAAELQTCGPAAIPLPTNCQPGVRGAGAGQFQRMLGGIAVDGSGDIYVGDLENRRVQKFDSDGNFLLMFGGNVDTGPLHPGNLCTAAFIAEGDGCGAGQEGPGLGAFETQAFGTYVVTGAGGLVFVGDKGRIQKFNSNGVFQSEATLGASLANKFVISLDVDSAENFYVTAALSGGGNSGPNVFKLSPTGEQIAIVDTEGLIPVALALDPEDNVFVATENSKGISRREVIEFESDGSQLISPGAGFAVSEGSPSDDSGVMITGLSTNRVTGAGAIDVYVTGGSASTRSFVSSYGPGPDLWAPPEQPPDISDQYAVSVDANGASVGAEINPRFWADTRYYVEFGTGICSAGGCGSQRPVPPGDELGAGVVNAAVASKNVALFALRPGTTYHYRFVAESSGGGPVYGRDPDGEGPEEASFASGEEAAFITPLIGPSAPPVDPCPSAPLRTAASARLPDCRAYEMVSPVDKNGTDIAALINIEGNPAALDQSSINGDALTYTTSQGFGNVAGVPYVSQYVARRGLEGWQSEGISPSQGLSPVEAGTKLEVEYRVFTKDLCVGALQHFTDPPLAPGAVEGFVNLYKANICGGLGYEALTTIEPPASLPKRYLPEIQGSNADGSCTVFYAEAQLTPEAAASEKRQVYENCDGTLHLLSVLANGNAYTGGASAGTGLPAAGFRSATTATAVSEDGSRVYWTATPDNAGKLYVRINAQQEQSKVSAGKCTEAEKACTVKVSESVANGAAHFWSAAPDGSRALFTIEGADLISLNGSGELYEFDLEGKASSPIAGEVTGVLGASEDADRAYFVSKEVLSGSNGQGIAPSLGKANLYLFDATESGANRYRFVATLSAGDARSRTGTATTTGQLTPVNLEPAKKTSRVSADGRSIAFMSNASLTGYDNTDVESGKPDAEVYVYTAPANGEDDALRCVSCNPTGQRPAGRNVVVEEKLSGTWAAALLPLFETQLYGPRVISQDGSRVFFNSYEALVSADANGKADVYEWELLGSGDCARSQTGFDPASGGCLSLISSGESPTDSEFIDASPDGIDVFFATASSLLPQDPGLIDIYDARVGGGYPPPLSQPAPCAGEACQAPPLVPNRPAPASLTFNGPGNVKAGKKKHKAHHKKKHHKKQQGHGRKASR